MKTVLITRPREKTEPLAGMLAAKGLRIFAEPLLQIEILQSNKPLLNAAIERKPGAIIITSKRGLEALASLTPLRTLPVFCVGAATAEFAYGLGYSKTYYCETAQALPQLICMHYTSTAPLLYARGEHVSVPIEALLLQQGLQVEQVILYRALAADTFSAALCSLIAEGNLAGALFFSRRTADTYVNLSLHHRLVDAHSSLRAFCMSEAIAAKLSGLPWQDIHVAEKPDLAHMLKMVEKLF